MLSFDERTVCFSCRKEYTETRMRGNAAKKPNDQILAGRTPELYGMDREGNRSGNAPERQIREGNGEGNDD